MRLSIVIAILDSHEIVRRQLKYFKGLDLPDDVEIIFVDDGSVPPLSFKNHGLRNFRAIATFDYRMWTQPKARNLGTKMARGKFLLCTDIDHILSRKLIDTVREGATDVIRFKREVGILLPTGEFTQERKHLTEYGFPYDKAKRISPHTNSFGIRKIVYELLGGVSEKHVGSGMHPNREEMPLKRGYKKLAERGKATINEDGDRPTIYMIPNGRFCGEKDFNPFGLFHNLKRKTR